MASSYAGTAPVDKVRARAAALLAEYPDLSEQEISVLVGYFQQLTPLQKRLMSTDDKLAGKLLDFDREQGDKLGVSTVVLGLLLLLPLVVAALIFSWILI